MDAQCNMAGVMLGVRSAPFSRRAKSIDEAQMRSVTWLVLGHGPQACSSRVESSLHVEVCSAPRAPGEVIRVTRWFVAEKKDKAQTRDEGGGMMGAKRGQIASRCPPLQPPRSLMNRFPETLTSNEKTLVTWREPSVVRMTLRTTQQGSRPAWLHEAVDTPMPARPRHRPHKRRNAGQNERHEGARPMPARPRPNTPMLAQPRQRPRERWNTQNERMVFARARPPMWTRGHASRTMPGPGPPRARRASCMRQARRPRGALGARAGSRCTPAVRGGVERGGAGCGGVVGASLNRCLAAHGARWTSLGRYSGKAHGHGNAHRASETRQPRLPAGRPARRSTPNQN